VEGAVESGCKKVNIWTSCVKKSGYCLHLQEGESRDTLPKSEVGQRRAAGNTLEANF